MSDFHHMTDEDLRKHVGAMQAELAERNRSIELRVPRSLLCRLLAKLEPKGLVMSATSPSPADREAITQIVRAALANDEATRAAKAKP